MARRKPTVVGMTDIDEMDEIVEQAKLLSNEDEDASEVETSEPAPTQKKRRRSSRRVAEASQPQQTLAELEVDQLLPGNLPKPSENVKTLGDMYAKYMIGESPEFKIHIYRTYPKIAPGGRKFDGFYDEWDTPLSEQQLQTEYGGGQYRVVVMGPHPANPRVPGKHYDSVSVSLAGEPNYDRLPRAQAQAAKKDEAPAVAGYPPALVAPTENPKLAEAAMKVVSGLLDAEREDKRRLEERADKRGAENAEWFRPMIDAERRRADDVVRVERERAEAEKRMMEERLREERAAREAMERRIEAESRNRPTIGEELSSLASSGLFNRDDGATREMLTQVLEKHRSEMIAQQDSHAKFLEQVRAGHERELAAVREAHRREIEAEREASRSREARLDERLNAEREERRRDADKYREGVADRDQSWKQRMDAALDAQKQGYESRIASLLESSETRIATMQARIDELRNDLADMRAKQQDQGDLFTQLAKFRELKATLGEMVDAPKVDVAPGVTPNAGNTIQDVISAFAESPAAERIVDKIFGGGGGGSPPPTQPQLVEGQVVQTPQGPMEVVRDPRSGQLAFAPKEQLDAYRAEMARRSNGQQLLPSQGASGRRPRRKTRSAGISAVPNLAEGLPKRRPPWEGGGGDGSAPQPLPQPAPSVMQVPAPAAAMPREMTEKEAKVADTIAKEVHDAVSAADEPEEFVARMLSSKPRIALKAIVARYSDAEIAQAVRQVQPHSAGATPAGQQFIVQSFRLLRQQLEARS